MIQRGAGQGFYAPVHATVWLDRLIEYKKRKAASHGRAAAALGGAAGFGPAGPTIPGAKNWAPLGPSVVMNGQAGRIPAGRRTRVWHCDRAGRQHRVRRIGQRRRIRSDDAGVTWRSCMDAFDVDPEQFASTSLACGAIAIDQKDPKRVYVGTGEGDTWAIFRSRIVNALPAYRGIGPIRSDDGGGSGLSSQSRPVRRRWPGKHSSAAGHPTNRENVIAATSQRSLSASEAVVGHRIRMGSAPHQGAFERRGRVQWCDDEILCR